MNRIKHYHDWLHDAHAIEEQAESILEPMVSHIDNYPKLRARIEQHLSEARDQIVQLEAILDRSDVSRSVIKDFMSKMTALGRSIGDIFPSDEIAKGSISGYVFKQFEITCYTSSLTTAKSAGGTASVPTIEATLNEEKQMADWLIQDIPQAAEKFLIRSETDGIETKK